MPRKDPEKNKEYQREWREKNKEKRREYQREWREKNPGKNRGLSRYKHDVKYLSLIHI